MSFSIPVVFHLWRTLIFHPLVSDLKEDCLLNLEFNCMKGIMLQFSFSFLIYFSFPSFLITTIGEAIPLQTIVFFLLQVIALSSYLTCCSYLRLILSPTDSLILVSIPHFHCIPQYSFFSLSWLLFPWSMHAGL